MVEGVTSSMAYCTFSVPQSRTIILKKGLGKTVIISYSVTILKKYQKNSLKKLQVTTVFPFKPFKAD
jgi:hypothetical protein